MVESSQILQEEQMGGARQACMLPDYHVMSCDLEHFKESLSLDNTHPSAFNLRIMSQNKPLFFIIHSTCGIMLQPTENEHKFFWQCIVTKMEIKQSNCEFQSHGLRFSFIWP